MWDLRNTVNFAQNAEAGFEKCMPKLSKLLFFVRMLEARTKHLKKIVQVVYFEVKTFIYVRGELLCHISALHFTRAVMRRL